MKKQPAISGILLAGILALCTGCPKRPIAPPPQLLPPVDPLIQFNAALFDSFLPPACQAANPALQPQAAALRAHSWSILSTDPAFVEGLRRLADLYQNDPSAVASNARTFADLPVDLRERWLWAQQCSATPSTCRLMQTLRARYLSFIYSSPWGMALAEITPTPAVAPDAADIAGALARQLPPSRLSYDPERRLLSHASGSIDYLIIGSGPAGSVLAHELRKNGKSVVLVERGPFVAPGAMDTRVMPWLIESGGWRSSLDGGIWFHNGQAVGGATTVNIDLAFPPTLPFVRYQIDQWQREGRIAPDEFSPTRIAQAYEWVTQTIGTRHLVEAEINTNNRILWQGARLSNLNPQLYDLNTYPPGQSPWAITDKRSAVDGLLIDALLDPVNPLQLLSEAKVLQINFDGSGPVDVTGSRRATGVDLEIMPPLPSPGIVHDPARLAIPAGTRIHLQAHTIIVSAGTLGSAAILLNSHVDNPLIGRGLIAHPSMPLIGLFDHPVHALEGTPSSVYVMERGFALEAMTAWPSYVAAMVPGDGQRVCDVVHHFQNLGGFGVMLVDTPDPDNRIRLNAAGEPVIEYHLTESDKSRFRIAIAEGVRVMFKGGAREVILPSNENILEPRDGDAGGPHQGLVLDDIAQADQIERSLPSPGRTILTSAHLQGSVKMGADPSTSVISRDQRVWGTANVYVMDSSIFPTSIGANPMQSVYTFAKIFADRLTAREK